MNISDIKIKYPYIFQIPLETNPPTFGKFWKYWSRLTGHTVNSEVTMMLTGS